jgi:glycosyltransferase involved in cell wall biosynthesis
MILGGAQENTLLTVEGLQRDPRFQVLLVTGPALGPEGSLLERARRSGIEVEVIGSLRRAIHPGHDLEALARLWPRLRRFAPHIVHTHSAKAGILGRLAARLAGVPIVVHTIHGLSFHPYQSPRLNRLYILAERLVAPLTDEWICVADAMREQSLAAGIGRAERYVTIPSGMEIAPFLAAAERRSAVRSELGYAGDEFVFVKVARLFELKGHEYVLHAFREVAAACPRSRLLLVGDGVLRARLEALAHRSGVGDRVRFTGLVPPDRIPELLHAADAVVHASLREGLARVLPQAFLCRRPVIAFDVDGAREVVIPQRTGLLVPPRDVAGLAGAMRAVVDDPETAHRLAERGHDQVVSRYGADAMVAAIARRYLALAEARG